MFLFLCVIALAVVVYRLTQKVNLLQKHIWILTEKLSAIEGQGLVARRETAPDTPVQAATEDELLVLPDKHVNLDTTVNAPVVNAEEPSFVPEKQIVAREETARVTPEEPQWDPEATVVRQDPLDAKFAAFSERADSFFALLKKNPFVSAGVLMLLLGVGFLLTLLSTLSLTPPWLRVTAVAAAGVGLFVFGIKKEAERPVFSLNLQGAGLAVMYLCALWAYRSYGLLSAMQSFTLMSLLSFVAFIWSLRTKRVLFALIGLTGALFTPVFASPGHGTFVGLVLYCAAVSVMSLLTGWRLRAPSILSASMAGIMLLLGTALSLSARSELLIAVVLGTLMVAYVAATILATRAPNAWQANQEASIMAVLVGTPLLFAAFANAKGGLSNAAAAAMVAGCAIAYLHECLRGNPAWKERYFALGAGLGLIAIGVGLEGAHRAMTLSASALGLILLARTTRKPWAQLFAASYWMWSVMLGFVLMRTGLAGATPLAIAGLIGLGASYLRREHSESGFYAMISASAVALAALHFVPSTQTALLMALWFVAWAPTVLKVGRALAWNELRWSALYVLPACAYLLTSNTEALTRQDWVWREVMLVASVVVSAFTVSRLKQELTESLQLNALTLSYATWLIPVVASVEAFIITDAPGYSDMDQLQHAAPALLVIWSAWSACAHGLTQKTKFNWLTLESLAIPCFGISVAALFAPTLLTTEASRQLTVTTVATQYIALVLIATVGWLNRQREEKPLPAVYTVSGLVVLCSILRGIALSYDLYDGALALLFARAMQPWVSALWALSGVAVVVYASRMQQRQLWVGAGTALAVLVVKMLFIDLGTLSLIAKVGVFLGVGALFIALGYYCPLPPEDATKTDEDAHDNEPGA